MKPIPAGRGRGVLAGGMALYARLPVDGRFLQVLAGSVVTAAGFGSAIVAVTVAATSSVRPEQQGITAGVLTTAQQLGGLVGLAVLASLAAARTEQRPGTPTGGSRPSPT